MNVKLLRKIEEFLLAEPRRFDMRDGVAPAHKVKSVLKEPPCGTVCCIAGAAFIIKNKITKTLNKTEVKWRDVRDSAEESLDLTKDQGNRLFFIKGIHAYVDECWPTKFKKLYCAAKTPLQRAKVGVARIEHFIKTGGAE